MRASRQRYFFRRRSRASRYWASAAIVASVAAANLISWGIPLLSTAFGYDDGESPSGPVVVSRPVISGSTIAAADKLGAIAGDWSVRVAAAAPSDPAMQRPSAIVPLPVHAPTGSETQADLVPLPGKRLRGKVRPSVASLFANDPDEHRTPALYPFPEAPPKVWPVQVTEARQAARAIKRQPKAASTKKLKSKSRDVVLVSPYSPGVRIDAADGGHAWRHRDHRQPEVSTLELARRIAARTARRFREMREQMTRHDARMSLGARVPEQVRASLLPVSPRPPRIVGRDGQVKVVASTNAPPVRNRLIRQPTGPAVASNPSDAVKRSKYSRELAAERAPDARATRSRIFPVARKKTAPGPVVAIAMPERRTTIADPKPAARSPARRESLEKPVRQIRRIKQVRRNPPRQIRRKRPTRRIVERPRRVAGWSKRRAKRINGFRPSFHRMLVRGNFYGNQN